MSDRKRLDPQNIDVDSLEVEELDQVAGGETDQNMNCHSCTCPPAQKDPVFLPEQQQIA